MKVLDFSVDVLASHKAFFLLSQLPQNVDEVDVWIQTPVGFESVDFVDVFKMADGSLLAAWKHPLQKLGLQNLIAFAEGATQILNLYTIERIWDIYDRPINAEVGTFNFTDSKLIDSGDWRCDRGHYGSRAFAGEMNQPVISLENEVVAFESFLSVAGTAHLIYIQSANKKALAEEKLNNSIIPITGRTLQEVLRLVYEWSVMADKPFNSVEPVAIAAQKYLTALKFSDKELDILDNLPEMQISKFVRGSETARVRPSNVGPMTDPVRSIVFSRMASGSLGYIVSQNPNIWDIKEVVEEEWKQLDYGIERFRKYYSIPDYVTLTDRDRVLDFAGIEQPKQASYVHNQLRNFNNKMDILSQIM